MAKIESVRGTKDILPDFVNQWQYIEETFNKVSAQYGYLELRTPIFEKTEVFHRSIGEETDIVNKEMYTFLDKGNESITLRPEMTAALVRSIVQNNLLQQSNLLRLWYFGPFFRYERPQKGRLRQFHQYGAECIGSSYPESDVEIILLAHSIITSIGIEDYKLIINSLGNDVSRNNYKTALINYLNLEKLNLSDDSRLRMEKNPLRVLDSKDEKDILIVQNAPDILDFLDEDSTSHFDYVKSLLESANIKFIVSPRLVRGLDYYSHTVFEFQSNHLGSQNSFGGGGRYDKLIEQLGGKSTPAVGFAMGVERLLIIMNELNKIPKRNDNPDLFIISSGDNTIDYTIKVAAKFRNKGLKVINDISRRSFKSQFREVNKYYETGEYGTKFAVVIGLDEMESQTIQLKNMENGEQIQYKFDEIENLILK